MSIKVAKNYYEAFARKDFDELATYIHPEVTFKAPLAQTEGKEALLKGVEGFSNVFNSMRVVDVCGSEGHATVVYELDCPKPIGVNRAVAYLSFKDDLIAGVELYYDPRPYLNG